MAEKNAQAFPQLAPEHINRLRTLGRVLPVSAGDVLFEPGDPRFSLFVLLSGRMEIVQPSVGGERAIAAHGPGEFTGEMAMLSGQRSLVRGRITQAGEVLAVSADALRSIIAKEADISEILLRAFILRRLLLIDSGYGNVALMGSRHSAQTLHLRAFLTRNAYPYSYVDLDTDATSQEMLDHFHVTAAEVPIAICNGETVLRNPSIQELSNCLGLNIGIDSGQIRDVIVVGAGPAGLAAAVYAASEGLDVLVIESMAPGGQAGSSSRIENYLGFPNGVSGNELAARATSQARKFGAGLMIARTVVRLKCAERPYEVLLDGGDSLRARSVVIATGAQYNKLRLPEMERFEGEGIYYGATYIESQLCEGEEVIVVGGGNSAGQAAAFLARTARKVHLVVRKDSLASTMSRYLIQRLTEHPSIDLHFSTEIVGLEGEATLENVRWRDAAGDVSSHRIRHVFVMTGASPQTEWLRGCLALDEAGFILTGRDIDTSDAHDESPAWPLARAPQMLQTSLPGVFAVGDARAGNVKRVASAVGEGSICVRLVHNTLAER